MDFTRFYRLFLGFSGLYWVLLGLTRFCWVKVGFTWFYRLFLGFIGLYWVLLGFTGFYWVLLGFTGFYWGWMGFYWMELVGRSSDGVVFSFFRFFFLFLLFLCMQMSANIPLPPFCPCQLGGDRWAVSPALQYANERIVPRRICKSPVLTTSALIGRQRQIVDYRSIPWRWISLPRFLVAIDMFADQFRRFSFGVSYWTRLAWSSGSKIDFLSPPLKKVLTHPIDSK